MNRVENLKKCLVVCNILNFLFEYVIVFYMDVNFALVILSSLYSKYSGVIQYKKTIMF